MRFTTSQFILRVSDTKEVILIKGGFPTAKTVPLQ